MSAIMAALLPRSSLSSQLSASALPGPEGEELLELLELDSELELELLREELGMTRPARPRSFSYCCLEKVSENDVLIKCSTR